MGKLYQIHHQFRNKDKTEFIAQSEFTTNEELRKHIAELKISHPLPENTIWMVCNEDSEHFIKTYADTKTK